MISKEEWLESMRHEVRVIQHLAGRLKPEDMDYRPSDAQRSLLELLQYITVCAIGPVQHVVTGDWSQMPGLFAAAKSVTWDGFADAMNRQMDGITECLKEWDDQRLAERDAAMPWGTPMKGGRALMDMALKCLVAYRMQLFLYAKAAGHTALGTANNWAGIDWPPSDSPAIPDGSNVT
ncbi:hypothetical protein JXA80_06540 [bacterium]|nr:hypothetical protein [candidate division CSSED10-310 bacterium]